MTRYDRQQKQCHEYVNIEGRLSSFVQTLIDLQNRDDIKDHDPEVTWDVNYDFGDVDSVDIEIKWSRPETDEEYTRRIEKEREERRRGEILAKQSRQAKFDQLQALARELDVKVVIQ